MSASLSWRFLHFSSIHMATIMSCPLPDINWLRLPLLAQRELCMGSEEPLQQFSIPLEFNFFPFVICISCFLFRMHLTSYILNLPHLLSLSTCRQKFSLILFLPTVLQLVFNYEEMCLPWSQLWSFSQWTYKHRPGRCLYLWFLHISNKIVLTVCSILLLKCGHLTGCHI